MIRLDQQVINEALRWHETSRAVWLCTVLRTYGSSPRAPGTMMSVNAQGEHCGSLSGGCIEEDFLLQLSAGCYRESSQVIRYGEGGMRPSVELPCGGSLDILIEYLPPDEQSLALLLAMQSALRGKQSVIKTLTIGQRAEVEVPEAGGVLPLLSVTENRILLPVGAVPELMVAGYSPVAFECIRFGQMLGFHVRICEHRPESLSEIERYFAGADNITIVPQHPARWLEINGAGASVAIVSLTHDPRIDELTMMEAINTQAFYLGVMGSQRNSEKRRTRLQAIAGMTNDQLNRIHAPVGLRIGSKTPAEIALSIMADIVRVKNREGIASARNMT